MKYPTPDTQKVGLILMSIVMLVSCAGWQTKTQTTVHSSMKCMSACMERCPLEISDCFKVCALSCVPKTVEEIMKPKEETAFLPGWCPALWQSMPAKFHGPLFQIEPWLLVIHSGSIGAGVAEYIQNPRKKGGGHRQVSTHIAWSRTIDDFAQCLPLDTVSWNCGGSRFEGKRRLNYQSISVELPGPYNKSRLVEKERIVRCVTGLCNLLPSLTTIVRHSDINPKKRDPGPFFHMDWLKFAGLEMPFEKA